MNIKTNRLIIVSLVICSMLAMTACEKKAEPAVEQAQVTEAESVDTTENVEAEDKEETEEPEVEARKGKNVGKHWKNINGKRVWY